MKNFILKTISLLVIFGLAACSNGKRNEEMQFYGFNEKNKASVRKDEIYMTRVTKVETLNAHIADITSKYGNNAKQIGSWDFTQKPSKTLKDEITSKAVELGANYVIALEKKDCDTIDIVKNNVEPLVGSNCHHILYYNLPIGVKNNDVAPAKNEVSVSKVEARASKAEAAAAPVFTFSKPANEPAGDSSSPAAK